MKKKFIDFLFNRFLKIGTLIAIVQLVGLLTIKDQHQLEYFVATTSAWLAIYRG